MSTSTKSMGGSNRLPTTQMTRAIVGSMPTYSEIPPTTPAIIRLARERYSRLSPLPMRTANSCGSAASRLASEEFSHEMVGRRAHHRLSTAACQRAERDGGGECQARLVPREGVSADLEELRAGVVRVVVWPSG